MEYRDVEKIILKDGWYLLKGESNGSHRYYKHPTKKGKVTIAFHGAKAYIRPGTYNSIMRQAGLK